MQGLNDHEIARKIGRAHSSVNYIRKELGFKPVNSWPHPGRRREGEFRICPVCGGKYYVPPATKKRGWGNFCSRSCYKTSDKFRFKLGSNVSPDTQFGGSKSPLKDHITQVKRVNGLRRAISEGRLKPSEHFVTRGPSKPEREMTRIIKELKLPFKYTGDGSFHIGGYSPDFVDFENRRVIEVFGRAVHDPYGRFRAYRPSEGYWGRIAILQGLGYSPMIVYDDEMENETDIKRRLLEWRVQLFKSSGVNVRIYPTTILAFPENMSLSEGNMIQDFCLVVQQSFTMKRGAQINSGSKIVGNGVFEIGEYSTVSYNVVILTGTDCGKVMNDYAVEELREIVTGSVTLRDRVFIGAGSIICVSKKHPNIVVGRDVIIMANSYVDRSIPDGMVYGCWGPNNRIMKKRNGGESTNIG